MPCVEIELVGADHDQCLDLLGVQPDARQAPCVLLADLLLAVKVLAEPLQDGECERTDRARLSGGYRGAYDAGPLAELAGAPAGVRRVAGVIDEVGLGELPQLARRKPRWRISDLARGSRLGRDGRPGSTYFIDCYSRMVMAARIGGFRLSLSRRYSITSELTISA